MLIYELTHLPTNKIYVGALKDSSRFEYYTTNSNIVKPMLETAPEEWQRKILLSNFHSTITWSDVVSLEQRIIQSMSISLGWSRLWNKCYKIGFAKAYHNVDYSKSKDNAIAMNKVINEPIRKALISAKKKATWNKPHMKAMRQQITKDYYESNGGIVGHAMYKGPITRICPTTGVEKIYVTHKEVTADGFTISAVHACCAGNRKTHKGFIWKRKRNPKLQDLVNRL